MLQTDYTWLQADALQVSPRLLGWELVSVAGGAETAGRIIEAEAYCGAADPASHAWRGRTPRTAPMFEAGGALYVYFIYGMHTCVNIVTGPAGQASAVLIRALEPTVGLDIMASRRKVDSPNKLTSGPGNLAAALGITLKLSGTQLGEILTLRPPARAIPRASVVSGPRIGIKRAADLPWRFHINPKAASAYPAPAAA